MKWFHKIALCRKPDSKVDIDGKPYLERWFVIPQNRFFNIYLHRFTHSDLPVPHDHPWFSVSYILEGSFVEHRPNKIPRYCGANKIYVRSPFSCHWLQMMRVPAYTIFITGPVLRRWGFIEDGKWIYHKTFLKARK